MDSLKFSYRQASESSADEEEIGTNIVARSPGPRLSPPHSGTLVEQPPSSQERSSSHVEGYNNDFVPALDTKHQCQICMLALREPYQTQCGHRFCQECILRWIKQRPACPFDNEVITEDTIYPDNFAKREILLLKVRCDNSSRGCDAIMELKNLEDHLLVCPYRLVRCQLGCGQQIEVKDIEKHEKYLCIRRRYQCSQCGGQLTFEKVTEHQNSCPKTPITCRFCKATLQRDQLDRHHGSDCPEIVTKCTWAPLGCDFEQKRKFLKAHLDSSVSKHLEYVGQYMMKGYAPSFFSHSDFSAVNNRSSRWPDPYIMTDPLPRRPSSLDFSRGRHTVASQGDLAKLRQRIETFTGSDPGPMASGSSDYGSYKDAFGSHGAISEKCGSITCPTSYPDSPSLVKSLQQRVAQQDQLIAELQGKVIQQDKMKAEIETLQSKLDRVEERLCNGHYLWRVEKYSKLIEDATKGKMTVIHSKGFYTSVFGYKMCLRINLNNKGTYLSIFVHLMQGEYDDYLNWPFSGKIGLQVLDHNVRTSERKPVTETFTASPLLAAFQRPTTARNHKGFGYMEFIPLGVIRDGSYIKDDTLVIRADITEGTE